MHRIFPSSGSVHLKIDDEIKTGTISGTGVSSLTNVEGTDVSSYNGATVELYQINGVPLTEINKTHTAITNIALDYYVITTSTHQVQIVHLVVQM